MTIRSAQNIQRIVKSIQFRSLILSSVIVTAVLLCIRETNIYQSLNLAVYDQFEQSLPSRPIDSRLLLVTITEKDIQNQGEWPFSDQTYANLLNKLQQHQPKAIGLDIYRDIAYPNIDYPKGRENLLKELQANNVIVIEKISGAGDPGVGPPPKVPKERIGFNDLLADEDNVVRRGLLYARSGDTEFYSFALRLSLLYLKDYSVKFQVEPNTLLIGEAKVPRLYPQATTYNLTRQQASGRQILIKYRFPKVAKEISATKILEGTFDPALIRDKVVLIGTSAQSAKDVYPTPYSSSGNKITNPSGSKRHIFMPGVTIHANIVSQILSTVLENETQIGFWKEWQEWLWIYSWVLIGAILVLRLNRFGKIIIALIIALIILWGISIRVFALGTLIPFILPAVGLFLSSIVVLGYRIRYTWLFDTLTDLPNRRFFSQTLQNKAIRTRKNSDLMAVLFLDISRLTILNDGLGREAGDHVILKVAQQLKALLSNRDALARVGGSEFGIWLHSAGTNQKTLQFAHDIKEKLHQMSVNWQNYEIPVSVNVGIATRNSDQQGTAEDWLRYADIALFQARQSGRPEIFASNMRQQVEGRWQREMDLKRAIEVEEFQLFYQPIISLKTGQIYGFEALVRWQTAEHFISPGEFIPLAEETGLIIPLGEWIFREACRQLCSWQQQFPGLFPVMLSVNLSGVQFSQANLSDQIKMILEEFGISGNYLKLEITESIMIEEVEEAIAILKRLKSLGLQISIDDFGTGYSSLSYLHRFPLDTLKVDRSFVSPLVEGDETSPYTQIVRTIVALGQSLNLKVIAEGIETQSQFNILRRLGCDYGQGYFFDKPKPKDAATELLSKYFFEGNA